MQAIESRARHCPVPDGEVLFGRDWIPAQPHGGGVYLLHGLGEHCGRYDVLARWLATRGWQVRAHDHHGHGQSPGERGTIPRATALADDAGALVRDFTQDLGRAPILLGHSLGGALAAELVLVHGLKVAALVLSSPAFDTGLNGFQRMLLALMGRIAPGKPVGNGLDPSRLSHDPAIVAAYLDDPLVHDRVSARLIQWLIRAGADSIQAASTLSVETLLMVAGDDALVAPRGSRRFADAAPAQRLTLHWYEGLWHEIFNEAPAMREPVLADLAVWLDARAPDGARGAAPLSP